MKEKNFTGEKVIDNPVYRDRLMKIQGRVLSMKCNDLRLLSARFNKDQDVKLASMIVPQKNT